MSKKKRADGLVYSTGPSSPDSEPGSSHAVNPSGSTEAALRIEKKGRGGKTVTILELRNTHEPRAKDIGKKLKNACGVGGTTKGLIVELQGDQRERARELLARENIRCRG